MQTSPIAIERATADDLPDVYAMLERHHLPTEGVGECVDTMLVARNESGIAGTAAIELFADGALLRSVAVAPAVQGQRVGHALTDAALKLAADRGADTVYLLTTTAERFFPRFGFEPIARADVPASVQQSIEFQSACPASAVVMRARVAGR